jgi:hypothetical protein
MEKRSPPVRFTLLAAALLFSASGLKLAAGTGATMTSPASGAVLTGSTVTFAWAPGSGDSGYWLDVGTSQGASDLAHLNASTATSQTVSGLPTNGSAIYVRLWTLQGSPPNSTWQSNDYTYTAASGGGAVKSVGALRVPGTTTSISSSLTGAATKAELLTPAPNTTLDSSTVTFSWNAVPGAAGYALVAGTSPNDTSIFEQVLTATSQTVTGLPTDGSTIYVTLGTLLNGNMSLNTYTFTTGGKAVLLSPAPGSTLNGSTVTFTWTSVPNAGGYVLGVGTAPNDASIFGQGLAGTSQTVTGLPTDGSTVYVTLVTYANSNSLKNTYTFTSAGGAIATGGKAELLKPAANTTLDSSAVTFTWNTVPGAAGYALVVGTSPNDTSIFEQVLTATSQTVTGLPTDGSTIYVTLGTVVNGNPQWNTYTFTTGGKAVLLSPASGSTLNGSSVTFTWTSVPSAAAYLLGVGTAPKDTSIFGQGLTGTSQTVTGLPTDGSTIYVTLGTMVNSNMLVNTYTFTGAGGAIATGGKAELLKPAANTTLDSSTVTFTWNTVPGATGYALVVGTAPNDTSILEKTLTATSQTVTGIPTDGSTIYVTLGTLLNGNMSLNTYTFTTGGKAVLLSPAPGSTLNGSSVTFTWTSVPSAGGYVLGVGTAPNDASIFGQGLTATSQTVTGLPTDGSTVYVTLMTYANGNALNNTYTFTSGGGVLSKGGTPPKQAGTRLASPVTAVSGSIPGPPGSTSGATGLPTLSQLSPVPPLASTAFTGPAASANPTSPAAPPAPSIAPPLPLAPAASATTTISGPGSLAPPTPASAPSPMPRSTTVPMVIASSTAPGLTAAPSAAQSAAALAEFPVPGGATRTAFVSSRGKSTWQERGYYNVAATPDNAGPAYAQQLGAAGWNELSRTQSGDAGAKNLQFTVDLQNGQTRGHVVLTQNTGGSGVMAIVTTLYPGNSAPALGTGATAAPATGAATSTSDRGTGDPADFPRLPGSIRSSFTTSRQSTSTQEIATYTAKCAPAAADAFYDQNLPGAGWDELTRDENLNDATKGDQISAKWQNGSRTAVIALSGSTAGGCDVRVSITTQTAP